MSEVIDGARKQDQSNFCISYPRLTQKETHLNDKERNVHQIYVLWVLAQSILVEFFVYTGRAFTILSYSLRRFESAKQQICFLKNKNNKKAALLKIVFLFWPVLPDTLISGFISV